MLRIGRALLERLSRGRTFVRRLPAEFGNLPVVVSPDAQLKYLKPGAEGFDPGLLAAALAMVQPGHHVWDVGANVGVFAIAAAGLSGTGHIVAIEADIWLAGLLRRTGRLAENAGFTFSVVPAGAYSEAGVCEFEISRRGRASNHLRAVSGSSQTGGVRETVVIATLPLDALLAHFPPPDVVKIDVEGAELHVLRGMSQVLREARPLIFCEVNSTERASVLALMADAGYVARNIATGEVDPNPGYNVLFVPREKGFQPVKTERS